MFPKVLQTMNLWTKKVQVPPQIFSEYQNIEREEWKNAKENWKRRTLALNPNLSIFTQ